MTSDRVWRFDQLRAGADEPPPASCDRHDWAEWCDRKAATARLLHQEAVADGPSRWPNTPRICTS